MRFRSGDHNIAGGQIEANTRSVLETQLGGDLAWERIAMLPEQARGLPEVTKVNNRYNPPRSYQSVEVEALGQAAVLAIVRAKLEELLPQPLAVVRVRANRERGQLRRLLASTLGVDERDYDYPFDDED